MSEWQPIESAPKDGSRVLLLTEHVGVSVGFFGPKYSAYGLNYGDAWGYGTTWRDSIEPEPTHWMPLPKPPNISTQVTCDTRDNNDT